MMAEVPAPLHISSRLMAALHLEEHGERVATLHLHAEDRDDEGRVVYHYIVEDADSTVVDEGHDLYSGVGAEVDYRDTMQSLLSFLAHYGEEYRHEMAGPPLNEWCYMHEDALQMATLELDDDEENAR